MTRARRASRSRGIQPRGQVAGRAGTRGGTSASRGTQNTARCHHAVAITCIHSGREQPVVALRPHCWRLLRAPAAPAHRSRRPGPGARLRLRRSRSSTPAALLPGESNQGGGGGVTLSPATDPGPTSSGGSTPPPGSTPDPVTGNYAGFTPGVSAPFRALRAGQSVRRRFAAGCRTARHARRLGGFDRAGFWAQLYRRTVGTRRGLPATSISGTSTDQLKFRWDNTNEAGYGHSTSVTLSVTDTPYKS